ncbi:MAG TPA: PIG-L family deacetylase [Massilibacterium sp.]|nr:PIG-L family deacetylase [Massilibacterium sp.]
MKTVFFSFAHPDDETFTTGGLIAQLSKREDVSTIVYSATPGDAGKCGQPPICKKEDLANVRTNELKKAVSILGVNKLELDTFKDGTLHTIDPDVLFKRVQTLLRQYKPTIVITFPPHGISGHKDHTAISKATLRAVQSLKGELNIEALYYATIPESFIKETQFPVFGDPDEAIDFTLSLTKENLETVRKALLAHRTQHLSVERVFPTIYNEEKTFEKYNNQEHFIRIWTNDELIYMPNELFATHHH